MLAFSGYSKINWVFQIFNLVLFTSKLNIIGITVHNFKQLDDMTTTTLMTTANLTVFPWVCQMETLEMTGLCPTIFQCRIKDIIISLGISLLLGKGITLLLWNFHCLN